MKYAALVKKSITIPGDERSRTNPGHGYPEHTEEYIELVEFKSEMDMQSWVERQEQYYQNSRYRLIQFEELHVQKSIKIDIKRS